MARSFYASYTGGRCAICDGNLLEGEELVYTSDDELVHADCAADDGEEFSRGS